MKKSKENMIDGKLWRDRQIEMTQRITAQAADMEASEFELVSAMTTIMAELIATEPQPENKAELVQSIFDVLWDSTGLPRA